MINKSITPAQKKVLVHAITRKVLTPWRRGWIRQGVDEGMSVFHSRTVTALGKKGLLRNKGTHWELTHEGADLLESLGLARYCLRCDLLFPTESVCPCESANTGSGPDRDVG